MCHVDSASATLQTIFEIFLHAARSCAFNLICSRSSLFLIIGIGNYPSIDLVLVMSVFNVVTIVRNFETIQQEITLT